MLHLAHTFCAGKVSAASEVGNNAAVKLAAGNMGTEVVPVGNDAGNGKVLMGKPEYGIDMCSE